MYADDIVIMAENPKVLQEMIHKLESYCTDWNLVVNMSKSKIMVLRKGGRLSSQDKWTFQGEEIEIVSQYNYLGVIITPQMTFTKHVQNRNMQAKSAMKLTWKNFLKKDEVSLQQKWSLYSAVCRSVQSYAAQIWGSRYCDEVDKVQRFFMKMVLDLPDSTPNYALYIEADLDESHIYMLHLHIKYICRTIFQYNNNRLPKQLSYIILRKNILWAKHFNSLNQEMNIQPIGENVNRDDWNHMANAIVQYLTSKNKATNIQRAINSSSRFYRKLDHSRGILYFNGQYTRREISWIFKARCDLIYLNSNAHKINVNETELCTLCNMRVPETILHFLGFCPILREYRLQFFGKPILMEDEIISILDGRQDLDWNKLVAYLEAAVKYRKIIINEFN